MSLFKHLMQTYFFVENLLFSVFYNCFNEKIEMVSEQEKNF